MSEGLAAAFLWPLAGNLGKGPPLPVKMFFWTAGGACSSASPVGWGSLGLALIEGGPPTALGCDAAFGAGRAAADAGLVAGRACCVVGPRPEGAVPASEGTLSSGPLLLSP